MTQRSHKIGKTRRASRFVQIFRTTPTKTVCPNFYVLAHANGCAFAPACSYCYLKSSFWYLRGPRVFMNVGRMEAEIRRWLKRSSLESYMLNTGNLSDSLSFERARPLMARLVELFRREAEEKNKPHSLLIVTKGGTELCGFFLKTKPSRNVVISFSINSPEAAREYEKGAAPAGDRMKAAFRLKKAGWRIRMRIDPMIAGYDYDWIIGQVRKLRPERVTLGTLRAEANLPKYTEPGLFDCLEFPKDSRAMARYPRKQRMAMYHKAVRALKDICPIGLCEETRDVWNELGLDTKSKSCNCGW